MPAQPIMNIVAVRYDVESEQELINISLLSIYLLDWAISDQRTPRTPVIGPVVGFGETA